MMFPKLWFTYPTAHQEDPPAKCYAEVVIIHRISANSYDIVQSSRTFTLAAIGHYLNSHADFAHYKSSECLNPKVYIKSIRFFINLYKLVPSLPVAT